MKIAIRFGDNDFGNTFYNVLEVLFHSTKHRGEDLTADKERLCFLVNKLSPIIYITHQNHWSYNGLQDSGNTEENPHFLHTKNYLQVTPDRILVNEEVDKYLEEVDWDNSETFILDTGIYNNNIYSI